MTVTLRAARAGEAGTLSAVAFASKASWGYDAEFMERCRNMLTIAESELARDHTLVAEDSGQIVGFYKLRISSDGAVLTDLWVVPGRQRGGCGKLLFDHAVKSARNAGVRKLVIEADPNAEGFYLRMGARRTGASQSEMSVDRFLPVFEVEIAAEEGSVT